MAPANLRMVENGRITQNGAWAAIAYDARSGGRISPWPIPVCNGRFLDVDAILARSLPRVVSEQFHTMSGKILFLGTRLPLAAITGNK